jgi:hypothetical protein
MACSWRCDVRMSVMPAASQRSSTTDSSLAGQGTYDADEVAFGVFEPRRLASIR